MSERIPLVRLGQGDYTRDIGPAQAQAAPQKAVLTATRMATLRRCPRQAYFRYELGLERVREATPLRLGGAFHRGLELRNRGAGEAEALAEALAEYEVAPAWADDFAWRVEAETVRNLLAGHFWRYSADDVRILEAERSFELPLVNPATGKASRSFVLAGKIDGLVQLADGRLAVLEYKTAGEDIGPDSAYWLRLRCDPQISQYVIAARALGYDVATVLYDVTRKPAIRPRKGESPEQFGQRLLEDLGQRPDFYFQRREVPRLEADLDEYRHELWQQAKQLMEMRRHGRWYRNVGRFTCDTCPFADLCLQSIRVDPADPPPAGYRFVNDLHPELQTEGATP